MSQTPFDNTTPEADDLDIQGLGEPEPDVMGDAIKDEEIKRLIDERDKLMYLVAESQNMRKRLQSEKEQAVQFANQSLIRVLIPTIDNFERAIGVDPAKVDGATVLKGLRIVHEQMMNELKKQNVDVIDPEPGTPFDPTKHEALMQKEDPAFKSNTIVQALTRGYALHGRTLRPAGVMVAK